MAVLKKSYIVPLHSTMHSMSNGELYPSEDAMAFFEKLARAGVGMVISCRCQSRQGCADYGAMTAWDVNVPNHRNKMMELVERIHFMAPMGLHGACIGIFFLEGYTRL